MGAGEDGLQVLAVGVLAFHDGPGQQVGHVLGVVLPDGEALLGEFALDGVGGLGLAGDEAQGGSRIVL